MNALSRASRVIPIRIVPRLLLIAIVACWPLQSCGQVQITAENLRDVHVRAAIQAIVDELHARQVDDTHWEPGYSGDFERTQQGGWTALVTLALLYAGESYQSPVLDDAIAFLNDAEMKGTYAVALRSHIWAALPPKFETNLQNDKTWLLQSFSDNASGWNYGKEPYSTRRDNSNTQYGALGLWEAAKRGLRIEPRYWKMLEDRFIDMQLADGGWNYTGTGPATGSMTAAGLTVLFITQDFLHSEASIQIDTQRDAPYQKAIDRGLEWFAQQFTAETNPGRELDYFYYLYGVERVGLASGYKYFGEHDWFREGAAEAIRRLCAWDEATGTMRVHDRLGGDPQAGNIDTVDLAFALMFLSRGRVPGAINKLSTPATPWNNRPRDVANLTSYLRTQSESGLNWQIVSMDEPPEEWLDASMLYFATSERPSWAPANEQAAEPMRSAHIALREQIASGARAMDALDDLELPGELHKLKRYIDLGGLLLINGEGGAKDQVSRAAEQIGRVLYPQYTWRDLPPDHPVYTLHEPLAGGRPVLMGLSNGVRELMVIAPTSDLSESFQVGHTRRRADAFALGMNLWLYASELNTSKPRLELHVLDRETTRTSSIPARIVRASHAGNWDAEPRALDVFAAWAWNQHGLDVQLSVTPLDQIDSLEGRPSLVIVSGTEEATLTPDEINAVRRYAESGGVVLFETTGGIGDFALSAERAMRSALPEHPVRSLRRHQIITGEGLPGAASLARVEYRAYSFNTFGGREVIPRIRGMLFEQDQPRILFSREDIVNGLLDQPSWGVTGYRSSFARDLLANIVRFGDAQR